MTDVKTVIEQIQENAVSSSNEPRMVRTVLEGQIVRQGDIYIEAISKAKFEQVSGKETDNRQLAEGESKGSRHIVGAGPKVFAPKQRRQLFGPLINATQRFVVEHPEHAHVSLPSGYYRVRFQREGTDEEWERVRD